MRRRIPEKREIMPDPIYGDLIVAKFINNLMKKGKKSLAEKIALLEDDELVNKQGKLNRDHVISNFSREVISKELLKLFE